MIIERLMKLALFGSEWVLYLLIILSVVSVSTMVERALYFYRRRANVPHLRAELGRLLQARDIEGAEQLLDADRSVQAALAREAVRWLGKGPDALADAVEAELSRVRTELEKGANLLGTLGNNAPFIGLFGTVLGVIIAFAALGDSGGNAGAMGGVMAGIAEALVATGVGLFVALPAVVAYNLMQKHIGDIESDSLSLVKLVSAHLKGDPSLIEQANALEARRAEAQPRELRHDDVAQSEALAGEHLQVAGLGEG